jgi:hypothetical protein
MLNHRHKRILIPVLFVKEMNFVRLDAPSGGQNRWEFPKGITPWANLMCFEATYVQRSAQYPGSGDRI